MRIENVCTNITKEGAGQVVGEKIKAIRMEINNRLLKKQYICAYYLFYKRITMIYLITYDLRSSEKDYAPLFSYIKNNVGIAKHTDAIPVYTC